MIKPPCRTPTSSFFQKIRGKKQDTGEAVRQIQGGIVFGEKRCLSGCFHGTTVSVEFRITIKQIQDREKCNKKLRNL